MSGTPPPVIELERWLAERLARELSLEIGAIDLDRTAASYGLDSVIAAQLCAELGERVLGRELSPDVLWGAESLRALCWRFGAADAAVEVDRDAISPGAALASAERGEVLAPLYRAAEVVSAGERWLVARLSAAPDLVSVACRLVDEGSGAPVGATYHAGRHLSRVRAWVSEVGSPEGARHELYVLNGAERPLELVVGAWRVVTR